MMKLLTIEQIQAVLPSIDLMQAIEAGFVAYSEGRAVVPPVGELIMAQPPGDVHIKYGYITGDEYYVIKVASGFYDNPKLNLPSSSGSPNWYLPNQTGESYSKDTDSWGGGRPRTVFESKNNLT